jgi:putative tryptophan/tyrosine transport system substrate-binding protein
MSRRRFLVTSLAGALATPLAAGAQQAGKVWRVGILSTGSASSGLPLTKVFQEQLRELGYIEGQNVVFEFRYADGDNDRLPGLAEELVRLKVDVLVTAGTPAAVAAKNATSMIPIVTAIVADPVGAGLVTSLARPGGNVTGIANLDDELAGKRLALLMEAVPGLSRVAIMWKTGNPAHKTALREAEVVARARDVKLQPVDVRGPSEFQEAFSIMARSRVGALIVTADSMFNMHTTQLVDVATKSRLPTMFWRKDFVAAGGLMSYGTIYSDLQRRAAIYVDRIAKGAKPADLPLEQATKFELVINLKTAKALGLTIPPSLLARADQVIE